MRKWFTMSEEEQLQLKELAASTSADPEIRLRAWIIIYASRGWSGQAIAAELNVGTTCVERWLARYRDRPAGILMVDLLKSASGRGRKRTISDEARNWVRTYAAEVKGETMTMGAFTKLVREHAAEAGYPSLANAAQSTVTKILKASI